MELKKKKLIFIKHKIFIKKKIILKSINYNKNIKIKKKILFIFQIFLKKKKNLCCVSNRKGGILNKLNLSRHFFNKYLKLNLLQNLLII